MPNEPWGYAPSHYGTWFNNPSYGGWLWQPPAYQSQASSSALSSAWLPALVAFFMNGNNGGALGSIGSLFGNSANPYGNANIGWIPLAPGEQYQPWYGDGQAGYNQPLPYPPTTMSNVTNIYNYYSNAQYPGGATIVPVSAWRNGNFQRHVTVRPQQLRRLVLVRGAIPVVPTTANLRYSRSVAVKRPLVLARTFVTNSRFAAKAPALARSSFTAQQAQFKKIVSVKPKVVHLAPRAAVVRPVYHPPSHPPVHLTTTVKSARHTAHKAKPAMRPAAAPKPASNPVHAPKAVVHPAAVPKPSCIRPPRPSRPRVRPQSRNPSCIRTQSRLPPCIRPQSRNPACIRSPRPSRLRVRQHIPHRKVNWYIFLLCMGSWPEYFVPSYSQIRMPSPDRPSRSTAGSPTAFSRNVIRRVIESPGQSSRVAGGFPLSAKT